MTMKRKKKKMMQKKMTMIEEDPRKSRDRESKGRIGMMGFQRLGKKKKKKLLCPS